MSDDLIKRLRQPELPRRMLGYDRDEVDALLAEVTAAAESGALGDPERSALHSRLDGVGEQVERILAEARSTAALLTEEAKQGAANVRKQAQERFEQVRGEADAYSHQVRTEADQHAASTRAEVDAYAEKTRAGADEYAERTRGEAGDYARRTKREVAAELESARAEAEREIEEARKRAQAEAEETRADAEQEADALLREARLELRDVEAEIEDLRERRELVLASIERMRGSLGSVVGESELGTEEWARAGQGEGLAYEDEPPEGEATQPYAVDGVHPTDAADWEPEGDAEITVHHSEREPEAIELTEAVAEHEIPGEAAREGAEDTVEVPYEEDTERLELDTEERPAR